MSTHDDLNELLDIPPQPTSLVPANPVEVTPLSETETSPMPGLNNDLAFARENLTNALTKMKEVLDTAILVAQSGDNPKSFDAVSNMLNAMVAANKELIELHRAKEETAQTHQTRTGSAPEKGGGVNIEQAVFVGKPSDLLRELRAADKAERARAIEATVVTTEDKPHA